MVVSLRQRDMSSRSGPATVPARSRRRKKLDQPPRPPQSGRAPAPPQPGLRRPQRGAHRLRTPHQATRSTPLRSNRLRRVRRLQSCRLGVQIPKLSDPIYVPERPCETVRKQSLLTTSDPKCPCAHDGCGARGVRRRSPDMFQTRAPLQKQTFVPRYMRTSRNPQPAAGARDRGRGRGAAYGCPTTAATQQREGQ